MFIFFKRETKVLGFFQEVSVLDKEKTFPVGEVFFVFDSADL